MRFYVTLGENPNVHVLYLRAIHILFVLVLISKVLVLVLGNVLVLDICAEYFYLYLYLRVYEVLVLESSTIIST